MVGGVSLLNYLGGTVFHSSGKEDATDDIRRDINSAWFTGRIHIWNVSDMLHTVSQKRKITATV